MLTSNLPPTHAVYDDNSLAGGFRGRSASVASDQSRVSAPARGKGSRGGKTTSATRGKKAPARGKSRGKAAALVRAGCRLAALGIERRVPR